MTLFMPLCAAAWATADPAAAGAAGEAPIGAMGGGTASAATSALSAPEYVQPTLELCGQCSPKYSVSRSTIAGVLIPRKLVAFNTAHSSRLVCDTNDGMTADCAIAKASTAACVMPTLCAVHPTRVCSPALSPVLATSEAIAPSPCHCAAVAIALIVDRPEASSLLAVSVTHT